MLYQNTSEFDVVHAALIELIEMSASEIGLKRVYREDVAKVDTTPSVGVQMLRKRRAINETGMMTTNEFSFYVILYYAKITSEEKLSREAVKLAEKVEVAINRRSVTEGPNTLNGLVYNLFASESEAGSVRKGGARMRAVRLTVTANSRTLV